jgi:cytosolic iron-sulfur protein assembly protein CIAO1
MTANLSLVQSLTGHEERVWHASWSPDGNYIASCSEDRTARIWAMRSKGFECISVLDEGQARTIRSCEWSPDGELLATASFDGSIFIWQARDKTLALWDRIAALEGHDNEVKSISWCNEGPFLATCGRDKKIWVWERLDSNDFECGGVLDGHTQDVKFVQWHPKLPILFSASYDDTIKIWAEDEGDWYCARTLIGHISTVWGLTLDRMGGSMVTCSDDRSLILWEAESKVDPKKEWRKLALLPEVHQYPIYSIDWNVMYNIIVTGGGDNALKILKYTKAEDGMPILTQENSIINAHNGDVNCVRWNPIYNTTRSELLLTTGDDGLIKIWQLVIE